MPRRLVYDGGEPVDAPPDRHPFDGGTHVEHVVVTGAAGFIGSHVVDALLARGLAVTGIDALTGDYDAAAKRQNLAVALQHPAFRFVQADLAADRLEPFLEGAGVVFHLAGSAGVRPPGATGSTATAATTCWPPSACSRRPGAPACGGWCSPLPSSVYGTASGRPAREDHPPRPESPYAASKLAAEQLCRVYAAARGLQAVILRYFTVYGPRQRPDMAVRRFLEAARDGRPVEVFGSPGRRRDLTYVGDAAAATAALLDAPAAFAAGATVNVATGRPVTLAELLQAIERVSGRRLEVRRVPAPPGDVDATWGSTDRLREMVGVVPATPLDEDLASEWRWLLAEAGQDETAGP